MPVLAPIDRMWNEPTDEELEKLPRLYATETIPLDEKLIQMHFFLGGCDWYVTEYNPTDRLFFGYSILNDPVNAEWGYISYDELRSVRVHGFEVDRELHWEPTAVMEIEKIRAAYKQP